MLYTVEKDPLKQAQGLMLEMMVALHDICEAHQIPYWLTDGTLLGSARHKGFIPWDDDADIAMLREDYERFVNVVAANLPEPFKVETVEENTQGKHNWLKLIYLDGFEWIDWDGVKRKGLSIDIFPFDYVHETSKVQKLVHRLARLEYPMKINGVKDFICRTINNMQVQKIYAKFTKKSNIVTYGVETPFFGWAYFEVDKIFPLQKGIFEGKYFQVPSDTHHYLTLLYGDYMKPPAESERRIHMGNLQFTDENTK